MRLPTTDERIQAILGSRQAVADYLNRIGKLDAFATFTKDDICGLIRTAHEAVEDQLKKVASGGFIDDEIPFDQGRTA